MVITAAITIALLASTSATHEIRRIGWKLVAIHVDLANPRAMHRSTPQDIGLLLSGPLR
jgi:hypothetical protein